MTNIENDDRVIIEKFSNSEWIGITGKIRKDGPSYVWIYPEQNYMNNSKKTNIYFSFKKNGVCFSIFDASFSIKKIHDQCDNHECEKCYSEYPFKI